MPCFKTDSEMVTSDIASANGKKFFNLKKVRTVKILDLPTQNWDREERKKYYSYVTEVDSSDIKSQ